MMTEQMDFDRRSLSSFLEDTANRHPEAVAVVDGDTSFTYSELHAAASQIAAGLSQRYARQARIGLLLRRSFRAVAVIFGVLKAGMIYVPIAEKLPLNRIAELCRAANVACVVVEAGKEAPLKGLDVVLLDERALGGEPGHERDLPSPAPDDIAIIQFTSGSTGTPKVVAVTHDNIGVFVQWWLAHFGLDGGDRVATSNPYNFGASFLDSFATAAAGAANIIIPPGDLAFPASLARFLAAQRISRWYTIPSVLMPLAELANFDNSDMRHLKDVMFAGEAFRTEKLKKLIRKLPDVRFTNFYGSTEAREITVYPIAKTDKALDDGLPIPAGIPLPIVDLFLRDENGREVTGEGAVGEVCVSGRGVVAGYLNVPGDAFFPWRGRRYYGTGDLAIRSADRLITLVGRRDHQVKTRGYRVNLNEVEHHLVSIEGVSQAVVVSFADPHYGALLRAHVCLGDPNSRTVEEIVAELKTRIPQYMIPVEIKLVEKFSRTPTGKIDRKALE